MKGKWLTSEGALSVLLAGFLARKESVFAQVETWASVRLLGRFDKVRGPLRSSGTHPSLAGDFFFRKGRLTTPASNSIPRFGIEMSSLIAEHSDCIANASSSKQIPGQGLLKGVRG